MNNNTFTIEELNTFNEADDLKIAPFRTDGKTYGTPTWIWEVVVNGNLYVRAYNGKNSRWYQSAISQKAGKIIAAGITKAVTFEPINEEQINQKIDEAYRTKYAKSQYMAHMIGKQSRQATIKINPIIH